MGAWTSTDLHLLIETIQSGGRPKGGASEDTGEIPSLGGENIRQSGGLEIAYVKRVPLAFFNRLSKGVLHRDDVLINKDGANTGKLGIYEGQFPLAAINEHLFLLRGKPSKIHQRYLYYLLLSQFGQETIKAKISGSAQPGLKGDFIRNFPVKVPKETREQSRISEVLSTVDRAIELTEALIAKHQRIKTGLMQDLLTRGINKHGLLRDPATHEFKSSPLGQIPEEWEICTLTELIDPDRPIVYGILMPGTGWDNGVPVVKVKDIYDGEIDLSGLLLTDPRIDEAYRRSRLRAGDLLFTIRGTVGRMAFVPKVLEGANITQDTARVAITKANSKFVRHFLDMHVPRSFIEMHTIGQAVRGINLRDVRHIPMVRPRPEEQDIIAEMLDAKDTLISRTRQYLDKLKRFKCGLMQDLLTGNVSVEPLLVTRILG